jgi:predicted Zn-dependent peptidase
VTAAAFVLANGLRVVLAPDPSVADVVVLVSASTDKPPDPAIDAKLDGVGGWSIGNLIDVPGESLELAVFLDARRFVHDLEPLTVVVAGHFEIAVARAIVTRYFGALPGRRAAPPHPALRPQTGKTLHGDRADQLTLAFPLPEPLTTTRLDLDVAERLLAMRLADHADMHVDPPFTIEMHPRFRNTAIVELGKLRTEPIPADELARALALVELDEITALEALPYRAQMLAIDPDYLGAWRALLHRVTPASIAASANEWLQDGSAIETRGDDR